MPSYATIIIHKFDFIFIIMDYCYFTHIETKVLEHSRKQFIITHALLTINLPFKNRWSKNKSNDPM